MKRCIPAELMGMLGAKLKWMKGQGLAGTRSRARLKTPFLASRVRRIMIFCPISQSGRFVPRWVQKTSHRLPSNPGDQLFGTQLLQELGIHFGQMNIAGRIRHGVAILCDISVFVQVAVKLQLGNAHRHRKDLDAATQLLPRDAYLHCSWCANQCSSTMHAFDRHHPRIAATAHKGVNLLGRKSAINRQPCQRLLRPADMRPRFIRQPFQLHPHRITMRFTHQHPVLNQPRFLAMAKRPDRDFDPVFLHIHTTDQ